MSEIEKKIVCKCENCGNEAEMVVTCTLEDDVQPADKSAEKEHKHEKVRGTGVCSHCGNEADMWVDI